MSQDPLVLNFWRPDRQPLIRPDEIVPVLWPARAWRVIAPEGYANRLNLFQRAVLGACRAGRFPTESLAGKLGLHPKLVQAVLTELTAKELIEPDSARPTSNGLSLLEGEETIWEGAISGWMFQDAFSGRVLPFFTTRLFQPEGEFTGLKGARVRLGDQDWDTYRLCAAEFPPQPTNEDIARALRVTRQREKNRRFMEGETISTPVAATDSLPPAHLVELLDAAPEPVLLLTVGRLSIEDPQPTLDDPFGYGEDPMLWTELRTHSTKTKDKMTAECVAEIEQLARQRREPDLTTIRGTLRKEAKNKVLNILSEHIEKARAVYDHLTRMELDIADAEDDIEDRLHRWDNARNNARKAIEALLKEAEARDPEVPQLPSLLVDTPEENQQILERHAQKFGFCSWPASLSIGQKDKQRLLGRWSRGKVYNLHLGLISLLLRATQLEHHRLRMVAQLEPNFFNLIMEVKQQGNQGSHDNESDVEVNPEDIGRRVQAMRANTYRIVSLLLDLSLNLASSSTRKFASDHGKK